MTPGKFAAATVFFSHSFFSINRICLRLVFFLLLAVLPLRADPAPRGNITPDTDPLPLDQVQFWAYQIQDLYAPAAWLRKGAKRWSEPFLMANVPDFPDINPMLFLDSRERLWLMWYTVLANQWETSLVKYRISEDYMRVDGPPAWDW